MKKVWGSIALLALLAGCATFDAATTVGVQKASAAHDKAAQVAVWTLCDAISIGAARRMFGQTTESRATYHGLCGSGAAAPIGPE